MTDDVAQLLRYVGCVHYVTGPMLLWSMKTKDESVKWATMFSQAFVSTSVDGSRSYMCVCVCVCVCVCECVCIVHVWGGGGWGESHVCVSFLGYVVRIFVSF